MLKIDVRDPPVHVLVDESQTTRVSNGNALSPGVGATALSETIERDDEPNDAGSPFAVSSGSLIMLVDDEPLMIDLMQGFLEEAGYRSFVTTSQPTEAMELLAQRRPDVLLLDLSMPIVNGFDILTQVRSHEHLRYTPVIIVTAESEPDAKLKALKLGATDFLTKPVDSSELQLRLRNTLAFKAYQDRLADFDALTGLPNRRKCVTEVAAALARVAAPSYGCCLIHLDVDRFKQINDTYGHRVGDRLLCAISQRLEHTLLNGDGQPPRQTKTTPDAQFTIARVAANGFAALLPNVHQLEKADVASGIARRLLATISDPIDVDGQELFVTGSVGIAVSGSDGPDADALLKHAEMAMYQAKRRGGNCSEFFSTEMNRYAKERLTIETQLRRAVERDELMLFYQPKVDILSGRIAGVEALARWKHPELGFVPPARFIPIAEETGLIVQLGQWVLRTACTQAQSWVKQGLTPLTISVNVSSAQFKQGKVWHAVKGALANSELPAASLVLELTESMLMDNAAESIGMLYELKELGVRLSIDDFGTGYSSLSYLSRFPLDELKVDRSFVRSLSADRQSEAIVGAIIAMAKELELKVVAEGVEKSEQLRFLQSRSCDEYQGYLFSRPAPATFLASLLRRINSSETANTLGVS